MHRHQTSSTSLLSEKMFAWLHAAETVLLVCFVEFLLFAPSSLWSVFPAVFSSSYKNSTAQTKTFSYWQRWQQVKFKFWWSLQKVFQVIFFFLPILWSTLQFYLKVMDRGMTDARRVRKVKTQYLACCNDKCYVCHRVSVSGSRRSDCSAEGFSCGSHISALSSGFQQKDALWICATFRGEDTEEWWVYSNVSVLIFSSCSRCRFLCVQLLLHDLQQSWSSAAKQLSLSGPWLIFDLCRLRVLTCWSLAGYRLRMSTHLAIVSLCLVLHVHPRLQIKGEWLFWD